MHQNSRVARPYAKSLLDFAAEQNKLDKVKDDMAFVASTVKANKALRAVLTSPVVKADKKLKILDKLFFKEIDPITANFLTIITRKNREAFIPDIANIFAELYRNHNNIVLAEITTAVPLNQANRQKALHIIKSVHEKVELAEKIDPNIIGGFIIRVNDKQYDESILSRITSLKRTYKANPYISKI